MISLNNLPKKSSKSKKRVGRGNASQGTYSGRGQKGQRSRSGGKGGLKRLGVKAWAEKLPKIKGFKSRQPKPEIVKLTELEAIFNDGDVITPKFLKEKNLISKVKIGVKILGPGNITKKFVIRGIKLSESAKQAIVEAGGSVEEIKENKKKEDQKEKNKS